MRQKPVDSIFFFFCYNCDAKITFDWEYIDDFECPECNINPCILWN